MSRWVWVLVVVLSAGWVASAAAEPRSSLLLRGSRADRREQQRPSSQYRGRGRGSRSRHRTSVPEPVQQAIEDTSKQDWQLNSAWADQLRSAVELKNELGSRDSVNRLREKGPAHAFDDFDFDDDTFDDDVMNDAPVGSADNSTVPEWRRMYAEVKEHGCGPPVRQLVRVSEVHPRSVAFYKPSSVLLRRCSHQTGYCKGDYHTCVSTANTTIQLPVLVNIVVGIKLKEEIEYLTFVEDTNCTCAGRTEAERPAVAECSRNFSINDASDHGSSKKKKKQRRRGSGRKDRKSKQQTCNCPSEFAPRRLPSGRCKCDCFVSNRKCKRQQRGIFLSERDNKCIVSGACKAPICRHGKYDKQKGRCPRKEKGRPKGEFARNQFI